MLAQGQQSLHKAIETPFAMDFNPQNISQHMQTLQDIVTLAKLALISNMQQRGSRKRGSQDSFRTLLSAGILKLS